MNSRQRKSVVRYTAVSGATVAVGLMLWALIAFAAAQVQTYTDATYTTVKTKFGRGIDTVHSRMTNGFNGTTYYAEQWGSVWESYTSVPPVQMEVRSASKTADPTGICTDAWLPPGGSFAGMWQVRYFHNPQYALPGRVVIDSPYPGQVIEAGVAIPDGNADTYYSITFHLEDRDGNLVTSDQSSNMEVYIAEGRNVAWRNKAPAAPGANKDGFVFSGGYYRFETSSKSGSTAYIPITNGDTLEVKVLWQNGTPNASPEPGDTYAMGELLCNRYFQINNPQITNAYPYVVVPVDSMNPKYVGNPLGNTYSYTYYVDVYDYQGNIMTGANLSATWTRDVIEAMDYDGDGGQTTIQASNPTYDTGVNHWKTTFLLQAPGKYLVKVSPSLLNAPECDDVIHFGATREYEMAGDVTPPGEVTWGNYSGVDNVIGMDWTNPVDADFLGVMILRNTSDIDILGDYPQQGVPYDPTGSGGPPVINTSRVVYVGNGIGYSDGDPCLPSKRLVNGTTYYYKAFTFDNLYNYSAGVEISDVPTDTVLPDTVSNPGFIEGDKENTVTWTNPDNCDFAGVTIRYRTDGSFPSSRTGADGSSLAGDKLGGTYGAPDSYLHQPATNGTPYFYSIWTKDDDGNWNDTPMSPSTYASPHDVTKPGQITDLAVVGASTSAFDATLEWTSTGDDGAVGQAKAYDIRFYDQPIFGTDTTGNWNDAWQAVGEGYPQPKPSGTLQSYKVAGLSPLTQYYFAIKAVDESGNDGAVSNSPTDTTLCNQKLSDCNQCHLMPPHDALPGSHPRATGNIGSHDLPIHASANARQCNVCHANGQVFDEISSVLLYDFNHQSDTIDINDPLKIGNLAERESDTGGTFFLETTVVYKYKNYSSGVGYKQLTGYCQNTYCHGAGLSSPKWGLGKVVCGEFCHETPPATGRHVKHYHPGQYYLNMAPAGVQVSGYDNYSGSGWSGSYSLVDRSGGNIDKRYDTHLSSSNAQKTYILPDGTWYITVCVGDPNGALNGQTVEISGNGGITWDPLVGNFNTTTQKLYKKVVDHEFYVSGGNNLILKVGNGSDQTKLCYVIVNSRPEAPKENTTLLENTPSKYGFACGKCHVQDTEQARHTDHVLGAYQEGVRDAEVYFDGNAFPKNPLAVYTTVGLANISSLTDGQGFDYTTGHSCVNTYCHGNTLNAGGTNTTPTWHNAYIDVNGASLCGACHDSGYADSSPLTNITTGSHDKHVDRLFGYEKDCYKCHYHTVGPKDPGDGDKISIVDKTHHVNGGVDVEFDPNDNSMKFGTYSTGNLTCYEVYCHSNGLLDASKSPAPYTKYAEPVWDSGSKPCNYCHGTSRSDGMPDYFNSETTPNSHFMHVDENHQECQQCHIDTTRDGLTIYTSIDPILHVNVEGDVSFGPLNSGGIYTNANMQCSDTYCHGRTAPPTWGATNVTCGNCHGDGVDNPNPGVGQHDMHNNGNYGNISTTSANNSTQFNYDFDCRFCHFTRSHGTGPANPGVRAAEVNFNTIDVVGGYNNTGGTFFEGSSSFNDGDWDYTNAQCDVMCHSDGLGGPPHNTTYKWTDAPGSLGCYGCHGGGVAAPVGQRMVTGAHAMHLYTSVYRKDCQACHEPTATGSLNISDRRNHVNGSINVGMSTEWGGTYNDVDETCIGNGCHYNGDPFWNVSTAGNPTRFEVLMHWTSVIGSTCTTCHSDNYHPSGDGVRTAKQTLSYNHDKHVSSETDSETPGYGSRIGCTNCHNKTALNNNALKSSVPTYHNNQGKDVIYQTDNFETMTGLHTAVTGTGIWGTWNTPYPGNCTVICHSYLDPSDGVTHLDPFRFPNWSSVNYGCDGCHGGRFANLTSGSHIAHVSPTGNNIDCGACHSLTAKNDLPHNDGQNEITLAGYTSLHLNFVYEPIVLSSNVGGSWSSGSRTCTTTDSFCHTSGSPVWGTQATCYDCHAVSSSEYNDTTYTYLANGKSTVSLEEYTSVGHGRVNGSYRYSGNTGAANASQGGRQITACETCHDAAAADHGSGTNFFRLTNADVNAFCVGCHNAAQSDHHSQANTGGNGDWNFTPKCVDCHDPHGDADPNNAGRMNYYMMQGYINYTTASTSDGKATGLKSVSFPANGTLPGSLDLSSYAQADFSGVCQVCHTAGGNPASFSRDTYNNRHDYAGAGAACDTCHTHPAGFGVTGASCTTCHAMPPNVDDHTITAHQGVGDREACALCHYDYANMANVTSTTAWLNGHGNNVLDIYTAAGVNNGIRGGYYKGYRNAQTMWESGGAGNANNVCTNTYCHGSGDSPIWGSGTTTCTTCHDAPPTDVGSHATHSQGYVGYRDNATTGAYDYGCYKCHPEGSHAAGPANANASAYVAFSNWSSPTPLGGTYNVGASQGNDARGFEWSNATCTAANYCHSDGLGGNANTTPTWGTAMSSCGDCHNTGTAMASNKHGQHVNDGNLGNFTCDECHNDTVKFTPVTSITDKTFHVNGDKDVAFDATNPSGGYDGTWTCTNVYCHSSGQATPTYRTVDDWNSAVTYNCDSCHGSEGGVLVAGAPEYANNSTASRNEFNGHDISAHVSAATDCIDCHNDTVTAAGLIKTSSKHLDTNRDVVFLNGGTYADKRCSGTDTACHGSNTPRWGGSLACADCHADTGALGTEVDDYTFGNAPAGTATINMNEYNSVGHGLSTASKYAFSNNSGAGLACEDCHNPSVQHDTATNPFRLNNADVNAFCATCHDATQADHHSKANTGGDGDWNFTPKCVDCHDPHGDYSDVTGRVNRYMIQGYVNYSTASSTPYGVPTFTKGVGFPDNGGGAEPGSLDRESFVQSDFTGLCQICHTAGGNPSHYSRSIYETGHSGTAPCTDCHTHDTGFQGAGGSCIDCHGTGGMAVGSTHSLRDIQADFTKNSHHINAAWASIDPISCAACHAEGDYSTGSTTGDHDKNGVVQLKIWTAGIGGSFTKVNYTNEASANSLCLGCHDETNKAATPYTSSGDSGTPNTYSWDGNSIERRYSDTGTTNFSKYDPDWFNVVPQITKAYSPHGNAGNNQRGVATSGAWSDDNGGTSVACMDCHNSHGSNALATETGNQVGVSYSSSVGNGAILKETSTYNPTNGSSTPVTWSAVADLCWDCHLGDDDGPKDFNTGFTYSGPIQGYYDSGRWTAANDWVSSFGYKTQGTGGSTDPGDPQQKGGHFGASGSLTTTPTGSVNGTCNNCHDPHGVYSAKTNAEFMVPALKGTWLTSPYKEDRVGSEATTPMEDPNTYGAYFTGDSNQGTHYPPRFNPNFNYNNPPLVGAGYGSGAGTGWGVGSASGANGYFIDDNTFGTSLDYASAANTLTDPNGRRNTGVTSRNITQDNSAKGTSAGILSDTQFAGLCLGCHNKSGAQGILDQVSYSNGSQTAIHPHNTVAGWASTSFDSDMLTGTDRYMHLMPFIGTSTGTRIDCDYDGGAEDPQIMPSGYRWAVEPGTGQNVTRSTKVPSTLADNGGQTTSGYIQTGYHQFPCSKCHTAHTSKLPRLMKTNCLDVGTSTTSPKHSSLTYAVCEIGGYAGNNKIYMTQCHNMKNQNTSNGGGWNTITGWQ